MLMPDHRGRPHVYRLLKRPSTSSCMCSVVEEHIVRRTSRLIRVPSMLGLGSPNTRDTFSFEMTISLCDHDLYTYCLSSHNSAIVLFYLTFRTLFRTAKAIFAEPLVERGAGSEIQIMSCAITHCCYTAFDLITTSCELRGPFLTLRGEPHGFGFPAG